MTEVTLQWTDAKTNLAVERKFRIHPKCERFPRRSPEKFQTFCEHIKANTQKRPIQGYSDSGTFVIIDGYDRLLACKELKIEPYCEIAKDRKGTKISKDSSEEEIDAIIYFENLQNRPLSKGAQAMGEAIYGPKGSGQGARSDIADYLSIGDSSTSSFNDEVSEDQTKVSETYQRMANIIWREADDSVVVKELAWAVLFETRTLPEAYKETRIIKKERDARVEAERLRKQLLENLRSEATDLAALVDEERMSLTEAMAALERRKKEQADELKKRDDEAERLKRKQEEEKAKEAQAHADAIQRYLPGIKGFLSSVSSAVNLSAGKDANREDVLVALGEQDRARFEAIEDLLGLHDLDMQEVVNIMRGKHGK